MSDETARLLDDATEVIADSVTRTISVMFGIDVDVAYDAAFDPQSRDFMCRARLTQQDAVVTLCCCFDRALIEKLLGKLFPAEDIKEPALYESAACEIVNVVCGNLKTFLNAHGYNLQMTQPYVMKPAAHDDPANEDKGLPLSTLRFRAQAADSLDVGFYLRSL